MLTAKAVPSKSLPKKIFETKSFTGLYTLCNAQPTATKHWRYSNNAQNCY